MDRLNEKEQRVMRLVTEGMTNKEIAAEIDLAEITVKHYVSRICEKLGASNRAHAVAIIKDEEIDKLKGQ